MSVSEEKRAEILSATALMSENEAIEFARKMGQEDAIKETMEVYRERNFHFAAGSK